MEVVFDGDVNIYLWGEHALENGNGNKFLVGGHPDFVLVDNRGFVWTDVDSFNIPSHLQVKAELTGEGDAVVLELVLTKLQNETAAITKTLVFGVSANSTIPAYDFKWEVYRECSFGGVVVIALIND